MKLQEIHHCVMQDSEDSWFLFVRIQISGQKPMNFRLNLKSGPNTIDEKTFRKLMDAIQDDVVDHLLEIEKGDDPDNFAVDKRGRVVRKAE